MERQSNRPPNFADMFGGVQPSKQAAGLARRAILLGEDPTYLTQQAGMAAREDGKSKVGFFGRAERPLNDLRDVVRSIEGRKTMDQSARKINKKSF